MSARRSAMKLSLVAVALAAAGFSPFQAEERNVREGNERVAAGDPAGALPHYDAAQQAAGPRAEIDHDRGVALFRQGRTAEARDAWQEARERAAGPLASRASQNLGNALAALGDREGAKEAFVEALRQDPRNEDARFNLEVLLRKQEEEKRQQQAQESGVQQKQNQPQSERDQQSSARPGSPPDAPPSPPRGGEQAKEQRAETPPRSGQQRSEPRPAEPRAQGAEREREQATREREAGGQVGQAADRMSREDAERMLDAFRSRERVLPLAGTKRRSFWEAHADRDW